MEVPEEERDGDPDEGVMEVIDDVDEASDCSDESAEEFSENEDGGSGSVTHSSDVTSRSGRDLLQQRTT